MAWRKLSDEEWGLVEPWIPKQRRGRPRSRDREILDAILYMLYTGIRWAELPECFPPVTTVFDRFKVWSKAGFFKRLFDKLRRKPPEKGNIYYLDSTVRPAKKGRQDFSGGKNKGHQNKPHHGQTRKTASTWVRRSTSKWPLCLWFHCKRGSTRELLGIWQRLWLQKAQTKIKVPRA